MPRLTAFEYAIKIRALKEERDMLAKENDQMNDLLDEIQRLAEDDEEDGERKLLDAPPKQE